MLVLKILQSQTRFLLSEHLRIEAINIPLMTDLCWVAFPAFQEESRPERHEHREEDGGSVVEEVLHLGDQAFWSNTYNIFAQSSSWLWCKKYTKIQLHTKHLYKAYLGHSAGIFEVPGLAVVTDRTHGRVAHDTLADLPECELKNTIRWVSTVPPYTAYTVFTVYTFQNAFKSNIINVWKLDTP